MATAEIKAVITADDQASGVLANFGKSIAGIGIPLAAVGGAITAFGVMAVNSFNDSQLVGAQLNSVLKSTGGIAGVTADEVNKLSSALQKTTRFSDEQIGSAQNMLLTFTNIGKNVFPDTTKAVLDMATAMGTDLKSTAIQVGKAMQDPTQGAAALQRVGVRLTDSQKDLVKSLQDTGDMAGAQAIILKELQTEFGGSAEAAGKTFAGQLDIARNALDDVMESIGGVIAEGLSPFVEELKPLVAGIQDFIEKNPQLVRTIVAVTIAVGVASLALGGLAIAIGIVETVGAPLIAIGLAIVAALAAVGFIAKLVIDKMGGLKNVMSALEPFIESVKSAFDNIGRVWNAVVVPAAKYLSDLIQNYLLPALGRLWESLEGNEKLVQLAYIIGGVLLASLISGIATITILVGALYVVSEAFAYWLNIINPTNSSLEANKEGLNRVKDSTNSAKEAVDNLSRAMDTQRDAADKLRGANLSLEGANLAVESAQIRYTEAVARYGAPSLEARSAAYNLKTAQERQRDAANEAAKATNDSKTANKNLADAVPNQMKAIENLTGVFDRQRGVLSDLGNWGQNYINKLNGISGKTDFLKGINPQLGPSVLPRRASGGPVSSNTTYLVGEQGPELFAPNSNGNIIPNNKITSGGGGSTTININVGLMTGSAIERREAASRMFEDLKDIAGQRGQTVGQMIGA